MILTSQFLLICDNGSEKTVYHCSPLGNNTEYHRSSALFRPIPSPIPIPRYPSQTMFPPTFTQVVTLARDVKHIIAFQVASCRGLGSYEYPHRAQSRVRTSCLSFTRRFLSFPLPKHDMR
jgi:hypothetical protein